MWRVSAVADSVTLRLIHLFDAAGILGLHLTSSWCIPNRGQMRPSTWGIVLAGGGLGRIIGLAIDGLTPLGAALALILALPLSFFLFLALLPFFANLFEFCMSRLVSGANISASVHQRIQACKRGVSQYSVNAKIRGSCCVTRLTEPKTNFESLTTYTTLRSGISTYLLECAFGRATASLHAHSDDSMSHTPFRNLAIHIYTCALSLRSDGVDACAAGPLGWGQKNRPAIAGEDSVRHS